MLEDHLKSAAVLRQLRSGPLAPYVDAFADWRHRLGYQPISIVSQLKFVATWSDWMRDAGFGRVPCDVEKRKGRFSSRSAPRRIARRSVFIREPHQSDHLLVDGDDSEIERVASLGRPRVGDPHEDRLAVQPSWYRA